MHPDKLSEWNQHIQAAERAQRGGKYDYAEATWMLAVEEAESFGPNDHRLAYSLEKLTECLWFQGRLEEALHYGCRALQVYEIALGPSHNDVGSMAYNVAMVFHVLNYMDDAEKNYKRALAIKTGTLGAKHPDVVKVLSSFADLLVKLGREDEALQLRATEKVVTTSNWSQTNSGRDVGGQALGHAIGTASGSFPPYRPPSQGAVSGSYPPVQEIIAESNSAAVSGTYPPVEHGIAGGAKPAHSSLIKQIRRASAENPYQTGGEHAPPAPVPAPEESKPAQPDKFAQNSAKLALPVSGHYGNTWDELRKAAEQGLAEGNLTQAEGAWREAMKMAAGDNPDNPTYCFLLETLGEVYLRQQNYERAENCLRTAYNIKRKVLGDVHVAVAGSASNLARLYYVIYQFDEAERFGDEGVKIQEKITGSTSLETATALHNLATVFHVQKKYAQAEPLYERAMKIKQLQLGGDHPDTVRILKSYASLLRATHRDEQADMLDQCVTGMMSGRWRAVEVKKDQPEEGWWKQALFGDE